MPNNFKSNTPAETAQKKWLYDMHCHPGFSGDCAGLLYRATQLHIAGFVNTVTPREYEKLQFARMHGFKLGFGLHPWWVNQESGSQIDVPSRYLGEIGLDFSPRFVHTKDLQVKTLENLIEGFKKNSPEVDTKVLSLHSVKSASMALDILQTKGILKNESYKVIFHWFSGSSDELQRAIKAGSYFSVNRKMLLSKRGKEYAKVIPVEKLLLETDLPNQNDSEFNEIVWRNLLEETLLLLADLKKIPADLLGARIETTSKELLGSSCN